MTSGLTLGLMLAASAQAITVVRPDHSLNAGPAAPLVEPMVAANPLDPMHLVVGVIVAPRAQDDPWSCGALVSRDMGETWTFHDFGFDRCIDPWVALVDGEVLFTAIQLERDIEGDERFHALMYRSVDGGATWSSRPATVGRRLDHVMVHPIVAPDSRRRVILVGTGLRGATVDDRWRSVTLIESQDDASEFVSLADLRPSDLALNVTGLRRVHDELFVLSFWEYQRNADGFRSAGFLSRGRARVYLSSDLATFAGPVFVDGNCASGIEGEFPGYPSLAADTSDGPFAGSVYHACVRPGFAGIGLSRSTDGGWTWSAQTRIDGFSADDTTGHVRTPMLAVNAAGVVASTWYDRRNDPNEVCQDVYGTVSLDGGRTFLTPVRFTSETSCPDVAGNGGAGRSWPMGGDYSSLTAAPDGTFHVVWADSRDGFFGLRHAQFTVSRP